METAFSLKRLDPPLAQCLSLRRCKTCVWMWGCLARVCLGLCSTMQTPCFKVCLETTAKLRKSHASFLFLSLALEEACSWRDPGMLLAYFWHALGVLATCFQHAPGIVLNCSRRASGVLLACTWRSPSVLLACSLGAPGMLLACLRHAAGVLEGHGESRPRATQENAETLPRAT